jgi:Flp pilus assembly protein TadG
MFGAKPDRDHRRKSWEAGSAAVEMAVTLPLLILLMLGAIDLGRAFFAADAVSEAVQAGVHYGSRKTNKTDYADPTSPAALANYTAMQTVATNAAGDVTGFTTTASSFCTCSNAPDTTVTCSAGCTAGNTLRFYVQVQGSNTFTTSVPYPGIPHTLAISRTAKMQVVQ